VRYRIAIEGRTFQIEVAPGGRVWVNRRPLSVDLGRIGGLPLYSLLLNHRSYETHVEVEDGEYRLLMAGRLYRVCFWEEQRPSTGMVHCHQRHESVGISAPLPGLLVEVRVAEGQRVGEGEVVAVLESMKMCLELRAPCSGVVCTLRAAAGQEVAQGDVLAVIEGSHDERGRVVGRYGLPDLFNPEDTSPAPEKSRAVESPEPDFSIWRRDKHDREETGAWTVL